MIGGNAIGNIHILWIFNDIIVHLLMMLPLGGHARKYLDPVDIQ